MGRPHSSGETVGGPLVPEVGVIGMVPDTWGNVWAPRHQVMTRLAKYFRVVWMDPPLSWREFWLPGSSGRRRPLAHAPKIPFFEVMRPSRWHPQVYRPQFAADFFDTARVRDAARRLRRRGAERLVLYLWRPEFAGALDVLPEAFSCYHIDDEYSFSTVEGPVDPGEAALMERSDQVFIHSRGLWEKKSQYAKQRQFIPNGVDFDAFASDAPEPADLRAIPHPRVGYVGVLRRFLNLPLVLELARRHKEWSFVVIGPPRVLGEDAEAHRALGELSNVHLLGARPVWDLPAYTRHLDVGIMPYDVDGYTKFIYPLKLHEYLAAGLPVVATPIRTLLDFPDVVSLAETVDDWSAALRAALDPSAKSPGLVSVRQSVARAHDWSVLVHRIALTIAERLGEPLAERVAAHQPPAEAPLEESVRR
jgi:glycosyltransferase involved in cell wall biosynthesis